MLSLYLGVMTTAIEHSSEFVVVLVILSSHEDNTTNRSKTTCNYTNSLMHITEDAKFRNFE